jgi:SAM-dependent methyltransferase
MTDTSPLPRALERERDRWDKLARDPYYAVLNEDGFRLGHAEARALARFSAAGEEDAARTLDEIRRFIDPTFHPARAVDFGCGVGRLTIPLARVCDQIIGVDISATMLEEARKYCAAAGARNVQFVTSQEYFSRPEGDGAAIDFVHSYIVFQHIPPKAGLWMADFLLRQLVPGGIGALHFTYARRATRIRRVVHRLRRVLPGLNAIVNLVQHRPLREPLIPMNNYDLGTLATLLRDRGCSHVHARLTDHGGHLGAMLLFRRESRQGEAQRGPDGFPRSTAPAPGR